MSSLRRWRFALQKALDLMVGQGGVKTALQNLRNLVEVQKKRAAVGVHDEKPLHFAVVGSPGAGVRAGFQQSPPVRRCPLRNLQNIAKRQRHLEKVTGSGQRKSSRAPSAYTPAPAGDVHVEATRAAAPGPRDRRARARGGGRAQGPR